MKLERTKNAGRNILYGTILRIVQTVIPFIMRTVIIYVLGVQYLGLSSLFVSILQVLNLAELGVGSAMVFSMYKPIAEDDAESICALMALYKTYYRVIGLVIAAAGAVLTPFVPYLIKSDLPSGINIYLLYFLNLAATVLSYWLFAYKNSILQAFQRTDVVSKVSIITTVVQFGLQVVSVAVFRSYYAYVVSALASQVLTNILTAVWADKLYPMYRPRGRLERDTVKQINRRIRDLFTAKLGSVIVGSADTIVISAFLGLTVLAVYQNYYYILSAIYTFVGILLTSVTAGIGNSLVTESMDKNYDDFKIFTFIICWIICVCCSCFGGLYQPFMIIWVGEDLMLKNGFIPLMCIYFFVLELSMVWATVKDAAGIWHADRLRPLIGASVNLILNLILVQFIGLYGIVLSTVLSYVFISMPWLIHNLFTLLYKKKPWSYIKDLLLYALITVLATGSTYFISVNIPLDGVARLAVMALICTVLPNVYLFLFLHKKVEFQESKKIALRIIQRR